ncbi:TnsA endonuclease N-terminal domain-containing protein [Acinetobacter ursingii]|uniref:TnsA endonuclease N-terminal domain-containing protein n=1 Tax=Acinetobacter ursingii TaxID=108980 RepID=UPI0006968167|nr:TnsA endonuclease N-terminal domain-containing protein [Acinetobacter ursingii]
MNSPARRIQKSAVKNIVRFPSIKANDGKTILVESILESKYCLCLEFDAKVEKYFPQPRKFEIPKDDGGSIIYTPDFEVIYTSGVRKYVEVKPSKNAQTEHYQSLFSRFSNFLQDTNTDFLIVSEIEIYQQPLLSNYEKLYQYRKRPLLKMKNLQQCAEDINDSMPLVQLVNRLGDRAHLREIYSWIALGYLRFDMRSEPLSMTTEVKFDVC